MENSLHEKIQLLKWNKDITLKNVEEFHRTIQRLLECESRGLILELTDVAYLNSAALGVIADAVLTAGRTGKELVIAGVQPTVGEILEIVHFSTFMKIFTELNDAYDYLNGGLK
ncbi:STAS domain-containing protein [Paenibacillus sp. FSL P4-0338]|uniref:STAS domain-containing protein n=1 Tax=unclassified Paenibacillus TaxID=185978 RepID=UPI0003E2306A|nr:STAS domain-containing protein [Paenibacillus sp. FSL R7-269]ETT30733.1 sulfate transporter/antisigma-factor antagonist STAS [Paenibacillus sp. FSL R7-269]